MFKTGDKVLEKESLNYFNGYDEDSVLMIVHVDDYYRCDNGINYQESDLLPYPLSELAKLTLGLD